MSELSTPRTPFPHPTKQQFVYESLRDAIVSCQLRPGERLRIDELARRFDVSIIPVREALRVLQSEGLVVTVAHIGATVAPIQVDAITEALTIMEGLELVSTRIAAERARETDLVDLEARVATMGHVLEENHPEQWALLNRQFHLRITGIAGMPLLGDMLSRALDRWERVWHFYFHGVFSRRIPIAQQEHHDLIRYIRARDLPALEETVRRHNRGALAAYMAEPGLRTLALDGRDRGLPVPTGT
jgi:DNA-binding GntR family transcriptional regulator